MNRQQLETTCVHRIYRASAGSGKTYRLTSEYLRLLDRKTRVDDILATTFTRKAAGEIFGRALTRLSQAAQKQTERSADIHRRPEGTCP